MGTTMLPPQVGPIVADAEIAPLNVPLIVITLVFVALALASSRSHEPRAYSSKEQLGLTIAMLAVMPLIIVWFRALWNNIVPRISGWRSLSFWEAAGVMAVFGCI